MNQLPSWLANAQASLSTNTKQVAPWLQATRTQAWERFIDEGWPTPKLENWRHTSLASLQQQSFNGVVHAQPTAADATAARQLAQQAGVDATSNCLVFMDGRFVWQQEASGNPDGVRIESLARVLEQRPQEVEAFFGVADEGETTAALGLALAKDGAFIRISEGVVLPEPVHLVFAVSTPETIAFTRNIIIAAARAQLDVIEHYVGVQRAATLTNTVTRVFSEEGARVTHARMQQESPEAFHLSALFAFQQRESSFESHSLSFGAQLARHDIATRFDGTRCNALLNGLYFVNGKRHVDHHTRIDHAYPNGVSNEYYRGILDDMARGVFTGRIVVAPGADGTDAVQRSDSLLLSRRARSDARPELEIYADDVKCAHGATVGQIDEDALFYLRTRGLDAALAHSVLTYAFAASALSRIQVPVLKRLSARAIKSLLPAGEHMLEEPA